jgi:flagellar biosynthesis protein FlhG
MNTQLVAIASGKGGVGKTWLAITLAHALANAGESVLLFDADLGLANIDIQLGLLPAHDLAAVIDGRLPMEHAVTDYAPGGFRLLAGRSGSGSLASLPAPQLDRLIAELRQVAATYDTVILDLGAGIDRAVRRLATAASELLVVATDEPTSLTDAYAVLKLHAADGGTGRASVVVNQASGAPEGRRTHAALAHACRAFLHRDPPLLGVIRRDPHVRDAIRRQTALLTRHPTSGAAQDVEAIAAGLRARHSNG